MPASEKPLGKTFSGRAGRRNRRQQARQGCHTRLIIGLLFSFSDPAKFYVLRVRATLTGSQQFEWREKRNAFVR
jgi:hypothetical protein